MKFGTLFLFPVVLSENAEKASYTVLHSNLINSVDEYIVENEKTARRFLKNAGLKLPQDKLILHDYDKHKRTSVSFKEIFSGLFAGRDVGLMSEAGCPGVADPGSEIVAAAHRAGIKVVPLVGPNSIILGLMASGFNGQKFTFHGYLPIDKNERTKRIKKLEQLSIMEDKSTQIFIETPFRNNQMLSELILHCKASTKLCVAVNLTSSDETIISKPISAWRESQSIDIHKKPAIFMIQAV